MRIPTYLGIVLILAFSTPLHAADSGGGGGSMGPQRQTMKRLTPEEMAVKSYEAGIKHRDKAAKFEQQALTETNEKKSAKLQKKIAKEYKRAIADFEAAVGHYPRFYQAYNSLGYALRNVGRYEESLAAYNVALDINPVYDEAIEYRGQAYLGLNRLDEAKAAYMELFKNNRGLADQLMTAMMSWVATKRDDAGGLETTVVEQFAEWVNQRNELASFVHPSNDAAGRFWTESP